MSDSARQNLFNRIRIQKDLEKITGAILARTHNVSELIAEIAAMEKEDQDFIYHWTEVIGLSHEELAVHFITKAPLAFRHLEQRGVEDWIIKAMDAFDKRGLGFGIEVFDQLAGFVEAYGAASTHARSDQLAPFLQHLVTGLGGRNLQLATAQTAYTDTDKIYLPATLMRYSERAHNALLYKTLTVYLWAQNHYGTWRYQAVERVLRELEFDRELDVFKHLECIRLEACLARDLPGLRRACATVCRLGEGEDPQWQAWVRCAVELQRPTATVYDSLRLVPQFAAMRLPTAKPYQGEMVPVRVREAMLKRIPRDKAALQQALLNIREQLTAEAANMAAEFQGREDRDGATDQFELVPPGSAGSTQPLPFELSYQDTPVALSEELRAVLESILQDMGEVSADYLALPAPAAPYPAEEEQMTKDGTAGGVAVEDGLRVLSYPEWDYTRQRFRDGFCTLSEHDVPPGDEQFVALTRKKYYGLAKSIRRVFEAILSESCRQKQQTHGDELDLDALVDAHADLVSGREMSERVYTHFRKSARSVAVMFMVDMSGSTKGWVNEAEREALVLLCEALETLGDQYAIYGFSGRTNKRCEVYRIKTFDEPYNLAVRRRISGITPKTYTRMGVALRHLGKLLSEVPARTKLLITLSDGKPEDYGSYRGRYGIEDTRHALLEIKQSGIHSFCITIDKEAQAYLPHMYGVSNYAVIDEVQKLPGKVADIYRRLTT